MMTLLLALAISAAPAEVGMLSTLAGWQRTLLSLASAAAVTWAIMKPELSPASSTRNGGSPEKAWLVSFSMRRSAIAPSSAAPSASTSAASATGSPWKLPPETTSPSSGKTSGLSVTALSSIASRRSTSASRSRAAPCTCGMQRRL